MANSSVGNVDGYSVTPVTAPLMPKEAEPENVTREETLEPPEDTGKKLDFFA